MGLPGVGRQEESKEGATAHTAGGRKAAGGCWVCEEWSHVVGFKKSEGKKQLKAGGGSVENGEKWKECVGSGLWGPSSRGGPCKWRWVGGGVVWSGKVGKWGKLGVVLCIIMLFVALIQQGSGPVLRAEHCPWCWSAAVGGSGMMRVKRGWVGCALEDGMQAWLLFNGEGERLGLVHRSCCGGWWSIGPPYSTLCRGLGVPMRVGGESGCWCSVQQREGGRCWE